jgi:hypothetical protein
VTLQKINGAAVFELAEVDVFQTKKKEKKNSIT